MSQNFIATIVKSELMGNDEVAITAVAQGREANVLSLNVTASVPRSSGLPHNLLDPIMVTLASVPQETAPAPETTGVAVPMEPQA
jgi:hypothetical protein